MTRAIWKGPFGQNVIFKQVYNWKKNTGILSYKRIKIWSRNSIIFPSFVGINFEIYNGHKFITLLIKQNMVGSKFGDFILTCKVVKHKNK